MKLIAFLLVIAVVITATLLMGWVFIRDTGTSTEVIIDKQKVQQDADAAVEATQDFANDAGEKLKRLGHDVEQSLDQAVETEDETSESTDAPMTDAKSDTRETVEQR